MLRNMKTKRVKIVGDRRTREKRRKVGREDRRVIIKCILILDVLLCFQVFFILMGRSCNKVNFTSPLILPTRIKKASDLLPVRWIKVFLFLGVRKDAVLISKWRVSLLVMMPKVLFAKKRPPHLSFLGRLPFPARVRSGLCDFTTKVHASKAFHSLDAPVNIVRYDLNIKLVGMSVLKRCTTPFEFAHY